jgi:succinate-semialdehyde dehydrogenase/glutarate-semialdehyde dehydrogenase
VATLQKIDDFPTTDRTASVALNYLAGEQVPSAGERVTELVDPVSGAPAGTLVSASPEQVGAAVGAAADAYAAWRRTPAGDRAAALRAAAAAVRADAEELGRTLSAGTGKVLADAVGSASVAADLLDEAAVTGVLDAGRALAGDGLALDAVRRVPRGVVAVLTPWNDPYPAAAGLLAAALVTGNTVVHKPSERSGRAGWELARRIAAALPPGVLNVLTGDGGVGAALCADERVAMVAHIGSSETGRRISATAGGRGARVLLENGGKDPIVVDAGVDPRWAAEQIALGAFTNAGQLCTAVERVYLHRDVAEAVVAELVALAEGEWAAADPSDPATRLGPMVDERMLAAVEAQVDAAVAAGARIRTGGARLERPGSWYPATVLSDCSDESDLLREETFGPVAPVVVVEDFDEGLRRAAGGRYGLAATVLSHDLGHIARAVDELDVGTVKVNAVFGGAPGGSADPRRDSGAGPGFGPALIGEFTTLKVVHLQPAPGRD